MSKSSEPAAIPAPGLAGGVEPARQPPVARVSRRGLLVCGLTGWLLPRAMPATGAAPDQPDVPWLAEVQRPPESLPADAPRPYPLLVDQGGQPIRTLAAWQNKRQAIRRWWLDFLRPPQVDRSGPPRLQVVEQDQTGGVVRQLLRYDAEPGVPVEAYLLRPAGTQKIRPGVVVFHPTVRFSIREPAGLEGRPETAFGLNLARRGCVAFCPRNFLWSDNRTLAIDKQLTEFRARHPGSTGMGKMLFDAVVALDILAALPGVDPERLGAVGHSLGAKEVLYLAALDPRLKVAVSSEGGIGTRQSNWHDPWYLGPQIQQPSFRREHHELLALVAPRAFLVLGGDSADGVRSWPLIEAVLPVWRLYGPRARIGLFNHRKGHSVPPEAERRIYEWFEAYL